MIKSIFGLTKTLKITDRKQNEDGSGHLILEILGSRPVCGCYMLELSNSLDYSCAYAKIYIDGNSSCKSSSFLKFGKNLTKRVLVFNKKIRSLRVEFDSSVGYLVNSDFDAKLVKLSKKFATKRMVKKLKAINRRNDGFYKLSFTDLYESYQMVFYSPVETEYNSKYSDKFQCYYNEVVQDQRIRFSIVTSTYNSNIKALKQTANSLSSQLYKNFEWCVYDDGSDNLDEILFVVADSKKIGIDVKHSHGIENQNISKAMNLAADHATGDFLLFIDHDDLLHKNALNEIASLILRNPQLKLIYSDEDKIDLEGKHYEPYFKTDFNYYLLLGQNYINHATVVRRDVFQSVNGYRKGYEGSQDYDLLLRLLSSHILPYEVGHIPRVLYHWRALESSTARSASAKAYTSQAGLMALKDHVKSSQFKIESVELGDDSNTYIVKYEPDLNEKVSIIIPTRDGYSVLKPCIDSIISTVGKSNYEILIVDNGSIDLKTLRYLKRIDKYQFIRVLRYPHEFNYSMINNFAVRHTDGTQLLFLNDDVEAITNGWFEEMLSLSQQDKVGCVGAKLLYSDGRIQHAGVVLGIGGVAGHGHKYFPSGSSGYFSRLKLRQEVSAVTAACLMIKKKCFVSVGGFDEKNLKVAFNDVDLCLKIREQGYSNIWTPQAELFHHESYSRGLEDTKAKQERFSSEVNFMKQKWGDLLANDPYYNPNLSLEFEDFRIR